jgi:hypothetical protein
MTYLTKGQTQNLVKMNKHPSKWPWFNQIGHIEWIELNQIDHYDLTFNQMNHIHLVT